ncbi:MAG: cupin domain-containing protein [Anaerolineae bacterium]|nr:cupin domain-containing protein [Anaerolineae bacterium]
MNIFEDVKTSLVEEEVQTLMATGAVKIERIVSTGQQSPEGFWYDQETHEWVLVLAGRGVIEYENGSRIELKPGDHLHIPAHQKHRVKETSRQEPTVWLAVHYK